MERVIINGVTLTDTQVKILTDAIDYYYDYMSFPCNRVQRDSVVLELVKLEEAIKNQV